MFSYTAHLHHITGSIIIVARFIIFFLISTWPSHMDLPYGAHKFVNRHEDNAPARAARDTI